MNDDFVQFRMYIGLITTLVLILVMVNSPVKKPLIRALIAFVLSFVYEMLAMFEIFNIKNSQWQLSSGTIQKGVYCAAAYVFFLFISFFVIKKFIEFYCEKQFEGRNEKK